MKVGTGGNLGLSREYHKTLFGPLFYPWWNCPFMRFSEKKEIVANITMPGSQNIKIKLYEL